jgi:hypothetical protein
MPVNRILLGFAVVIDTHGTDVIKGNCFDDPVQNFNHKSLLLEKIKVCPDRRSDTKMLKTTVTAVGVVAVIVKFCYLL